jgi:hypothetical protein
MAQPSILQPLGGPLAGQRLEFTGGDVVIGSAPDCGVRLDAPGVEPHHAQIVINVTGATIYRLEGVVGVNDDVVLGDSLLRSGDFVWIGEPGAETSMMLQFTLGDVVDAAAVAAPAEEVVEELVSDEVMPHQEADHEMVVEESLVHEPIEHEAALEPHVEEHAFEEAHLVEPVHELEPPELEPAELEPAELEPAHELVHEELQPAEQLPASFGAPAPAAFSPTSTGSIVPPAPWLAAAAQAQVSEPKSDYGSAWEQPPKPAPVEEPPPPPPPAPAPPPPKPVARPAASSSVSTSTPAGGTKRPGTAPPRKSTDPVLKPPPSPPPGRTTSSTPMIVGSLVALVVLAIGGYVMLSGPPAPAPPAPTPAPTPVVVSTPPPVATTPVPEPTQVAVAEPTVDAPPPEPTPTAPTAAAPTPRAAATPPPRATPTPRTTPTPRATPPPATRPGAPAPTVAPVVAAPAAPLSQAPRLLEEARTAVASRDYAKAAQALDQLLKLEPGNAEAATRKAEVDARMAAANRKFSVGTTATIGGKAAKGPTGFDLGGGGAVKTDYSAQIRCTTTPATIEAGTLYTVRCSIFNIGAKGFKLDNVAANETIDGAKAAGAGVTPKQELSPQSDAVIYEKSGAWSAKSQWSLELVAKTNKDESFRAVYNWR